MRRWSVSVSRARSIHYDSSARRLPRPALPKSKSNLWLVFLKSSPQTKYRRVQADTTPPLANAGPNLFPCSINPAISFRKSLTAIAIGKTTPENQMPKLSAIRVRATFLHWDSVQSSRGVVHLRDLLNRKRFQEVRANYLKSV